MNNQTEAKAALMKAWPHIVEECRQVLGSELHYQAMIYHCLRQYGKVPIDQIGMNVKMLIDNPQTELYQQLNDKKNPYYQNGFEPIPDIVIFKRSVECDWRRRKYEITRKTMLMAIEVKASEREKTRLTSGEIIKDIDKLRALREEVQFFNGSVIPVVMIIDTAPLPEEQMTSSALGKVRNYAKNEGVGVYYVSQDKKIQPEW